MQVTVAFCITVFAFAAVFGDAGSCSGNGSLRPLGDAVCPIYCPKWGLGRGEGLLRAASRQAGPACPTPRRPGSPATWPAALGSGTSPLSKMWFKRPEKASHVFFFFLSWRKWCPLQQEPPADTAPARRGLSPAIWKTSSLLCIQPGIVLPCSNSLTVSKR